MRVTNSLFYTNSKNDYQRNMQELYKANTQISSGIKIQNGFEDSGVYVDTMRLNYEVATLEQVKESTSKAQTFANNTDNVLNQFTDLLTTFKTKMIQASSEVNGPTSLNAIANELEALRTNMIALGNTSIKGKFLFSGSASSIKPISSDGTYNGNNHKLEAIVGADVQIPYNIDGEELFLGVDSDYHRMVSTNVPMYNQSKLHPDIMVVNSGVTASEEVYLTQDDTIRDMVGDTDTDATNDPNAVFHVSGKKPNGETFNSAIEMQSGEKISELLEKIGDAFGNTPTNEVVNVNMNDYGQIEVKDLNQGNQQLQFHIVGAVDRDASVGSSGQATKIKDTLSSFYDMSNIQIVEFQKSNFVPSNSLSKITTVQDIYSPGRFTLGAPMFQSDGDFVKTSTKLRDFMPDELDQIKISGKDNSGNTVNPIPPNDVLTIDDDTTVQNLLNSVSNVFGVSARLEDGQIYIEAGSNSDFEANQLKIDLEAKKYAGDGEVQSFQITNSTVGAGETITIAGHSINLTHPSTAEDIAVAIATEEANIIASAAALGTPISISEIRSDGDKVYIDFSETEQDAAPLLPSSATITNGGSVEESKYIASRLSEIQTFEIKDDPIVDGNIAFVSNNSPADDIVITFGPSTPTRDTVNEIALAIKNAFDGAGYPFTDSNGNRVTAVSIDNGKVEFTYDQADGNVDPLEITISQAIAGFDDLTITNSNYRTITQGSGSQIVNAFSNHEGVNLNRINFEKEGNTLSSNVSQTIKETNEFATASTKLIDVAGMDSLDGKVINFDYINKNGTKSHGEINLKDSGSTFKIDADNTGTYEENEEFDLLDSKGNVTAAEDVSYQQLMDVVSLALSGFTPSEKLSYGIEEAVSVITNPTTTTLQKEDAFDKAVDGYDDKTQEYISDAIDLGLRASASGSAFDISEYDEAKKMADLVQYGKWTDSAKNTADVHLDNKGQINIADNTSTETNMQLSFSENTFDGSFAFSFMANDAVKIDDPSIDFYQDLEKIIEQVRLGEFKMDAENSDSRGLGLNNSLTKINHLMDHINKSQTKIGSYSNALSQANERSELLSINVQTVRSEVIDVDRAEAYIKFNQLFTSYQAMLSTVSKINSMTLLNYM